MSTPHIYTLYPKLPSPWPQARIEMMMQLLKSGKPGKETARQLNVSFPELNPVTSRAVITRAHKMQTDWANHPNRKKVSWTEERIKYLRYLRSLGLVGTEALVLMKLKFPRVPFTINTINGAVNWHNLPRLGIRYDKYSNRNGPPDSTPNFRPEILDDNWGSTDFGTDNITAQENSYDKSIGKSIKVVYPTVIPTKSSTSFS